MSRTEMPSRHTSLAIYPRMLGYTVFLLMHVTNSVHLFLSFKRHANDPVVKRFHDDQFKYLTIWNIYMQIFYSALGLSCDVLTLTNEGKDSSLLKTLKRIRDPIFSCFVFPYTFTVFTVFWTVFSYERALMLPPSVDNAISWTANHVIHTVIVLVVLWEIAFRPRKAPDNHVPSLLLTFSYAAAYLVVIITSYINLGIWVYPILNVLHGTIYQYLFFAVAVLSAQVYYFLQWYLNDLVWGNREDVKKKIH